MSRVSCISDKMYLAKFSPYQFENFLLSDFGEPFLRKDLLDILRYVKGQGFERVEVVTTGNLIKETIRKDLPAGFQTSEFVQEHGFLDFIVERKNLKNKRTRNNCLNIFILKT